MGDLAIIDGLPRSTSVVALADSKLRFISRESFQACAQRHPEIHEYLVTLLASRLRETDKTASAFLSAKGRVAHALRSRLPKFSARIRDRMEFSSATCSVRKTSRR